MKPEQIFERELKRIAPLYKCAYVKIPDTKMLNANNRNNNRENKRPFDGMLITPNFNYCIECKYQYNKLLPHQNIMKIMVDAINNSYYIFRKRKLKEGFVYTIEKNGILLKTNKIEELIKYFLKEKK